MSFYVTLPSNSSMEFFPNNSLTNYITKLKRNIKLEGEYEVALVELMYPQNWKYKRDGNIIFKESKRIETFKVKFSNYDTIENLIVAINEFAVKKTLPLQCTFVELKVTFQITSALVIEFTDGINDELGIKYTKMSTGTDPATFNGQISQNYIKSISSLYVYTDIIDYQYVGDTFAPLLRIVGVNENFENHGKYIDQIFTSPHYIPLSRYSIDTVEINIRDDTGEAIHFESGKVLVKLHFRPKSYF